MRSALRSIPVISFRAPLSHSNYPILSRITPFQFIHSPGLQSQRQFTASVHTMTDTNQGGDPSKKTYHKKATGNALITVKHHSKEDELKLYGSAFW